MELSSGFNVLKQTLSDKFQIQCIMADNSDTEELRNEIKRLEKEKSDYERKKERENLEQKLKELKGALKGSSSVASSPSNAGTNNIRKSRKDCSPTVQESFNRIKNKLDSSIQSDNDDTDSNNVSDKSSSEEDEAEEVMTAQHKQKIQKHRDTLVENMIPDDIFNDMIAGKILTTADVSRIKKKSTRESVNEELLNNLVLKSDRAFFVFTKALRKTLQEYLANLLEPPKKKKRKRQQREMNISLDVDKVIPTNTTPSTCTCQEVEEQILMMSKNAYKHIRRRDQSASAFEQFRKELESTNTVIKDSMEIMNTLKILCRHGEVSGIMRGSVKYKLKFQSIEDLENIWRLYQSRELITSIQSSLITPRILQYFKLKDIQLGVRINENEYQACRRDLTDWHKVSRKRRVKEKSGSHVQPQVQINPGQDVENSPSPKSLHPLHHHGRRKAFNELQRNHVSNQETVLNP